MATFACHFLLHERGLVVNELAGFGKVNGRPWLSCGFMVSSELGTFKAEEAAAPILDIVSC